MNRFRKVFHGETSRGEWPRFRKIFAAYCREIGLPRGLKIYKQSPEYLKQYRRDNRIELNLQSAERRRNLRKSSPKKVRELSRLERAKQWARPEFRVRANLRRRVHKALNGVCKSARTGELLGCSIMELRAHLEVQFRPGMTWENYGPVWHVDHRRPCASFDLLDPEQQRECFNFKNLQPLFAGENWSKGDQYGGQ